MSELTPTVPIEELADERDGLRRSAIRLCAMILADAAGARGRRALAGRRAARPGDRRVALRYVRRLDDLSGRAAAAQN